MRAAPQRYSIVLLGWLATVATSLSFLPALTDRTFLLLGALFAGLVVGTGVLLRLVRTPPVLVLVAQLLVLVEALAVGYGHSLKFGFIPTPKTLSGISDLVSKGIDISQRYAAPAPANAGLVLMVVFAIALVAVSVDALAAGIGRVPLAGLPLLALYTVPVAALPKGIPFVFFLPGAACYIALLMADERDRLSHWGQLATRTPAEQSRSIDLSALRGTGRRIGLVALSLAVVIPVFVPAFSVSLLDRNRAGGIGGSGSGPGGQTLGFDDPMISMASSLRRKTPVALLDVASDGVAPQYLRLAVLDQPGPNNWSHRPIDQADTRNLRTILPDPAGLGPGVRTIAHTMVVSLTRDFPSNSSWLPIPFDAHFVDAGEQPQVDAGDKFGFVPDDETVAVRDRSALRSLPPYEVSYAEVDPTEQQLRDSSPAPAQIRKRYGEVPGGVPAIVGSTARQVTATGRTPYEKALLLQGFFRDQGSFTYDTSAAYGYGYNAMSAFLIQRRGFCQHFAATMAMMARTLNIPSRVVVGFLSSSAKDAQGHFVFTSHDVHSWPELYFDGVGWVRFEPTPRSNAPFPSYAPRTAAPNPPTAQPSSASARDPLGDRTALQHGASSATSDGTNGGRPGGSLPSTPWLVLIGLGLLACVPALSRWGLRRARMSRPLDDAAAAEAAWTELRDSMLDLRLPWTGSMTPRARERSVAQLLGRDPDALHALQRLARSVERARYADRPMAGGSPGSDAKTVIAVLSRSAGRAGRLRAAMLPASLLNEVRKRADDLRSRMHAWRRPGERPSSD